ncbi:MAG: hypothetical protein HRU70_13725 [Phycisphaeraceae bacterium]|nr:MAG: hypothetical protein HRU70_13725 [Phycisphaeraceae bacterium]
MTTDTTGLIRMFEDVPEGADATVATAEHLGREQVIERILGINPTASSLFLSSFEDDQLRAYLEHLVVMMAPRGPRSAGWVRRGETPAIVSAEPEE